MRSTVWISILLFVSGGCGLSYQILWRELLLPSIGNSTWATTTVITTFMFGLALGSWISGKIKTQKPFYIYAWIEIGIAIYSIFALFLFHHIDIILSPIYSLFIENFFAFISAQFCLVFAIIIIPSTLMGVRLPLFISHISQSKNFYKNTATWYSLNTLGTAIGVLVISFFFLPKFGITISSIIITCISLVLATVSFYINQSYSYEIPKDTKKQSMSVSKILYLWAFTCGTIGLFLEISWTRILSMIFGPSTYTLSIILFSILLSIAFGSWWIRKFIFTIKTYRSFLHSLLLYSLLFIIVSLYIINYLPSLFLSLTYLCQGNFSLFLVLQAGITGVVIFVPMAIFGMILPILVIGYKLETNVTNKAMANIYACNILGGIAGCILASFLSIPLIGVLFSLKFCIYIGLTFLVISIFFDEQLFLSHKILKTIIPLCVIIIIYVSPQINTQVLSNNIFKKALAKTKNTKSNKPRLIYSKDGINATVTVHRDFYHTSLNINGKTDASTTENLSTHYLLGHIPMFLASKTKDIFVLGLGSGATLRAVASHSVKNIDVVEMEKAVVSASHYFKAINKNVLGRENVNLFIEDARIFLKYRSKKYDVIISEASNPWMESSGSVFTQEFYNIVKKKLQPGGIFCQWIQGHDISKNTFSAILSTLHSEFSHIYIFKQNFDYICVATTKPIFTSHALLQKKFTGNDLLETLKRTRIDNPYKLLSGFFASTPDDSYYVPHTNKDNNVFLKYQTAIEMYKGEHLALDEIDGSIYFERVKKYFFSDVSNEKLTDGLINAIRVCAPEQWKKVKEMAQKTSQKTHTEAMAIIIKEKYKLLQNKDEILQKAAVLLEEGKVQKAMIQIEQSLSIDSLNPAPYRLLAKIYTRLRKHKLALKCHLQIVWLAPEDYISRLNIGLLLYEDGKKKEGEENIHHAFNIRSNYADGRLAWIALLRRNKEEKKEKEFYEISLNKLKGEEKKLFLQMYYDLVK